jgi:lactoylglutathione lyase
MEVFMKIAYATMIVKSTEESVRFYTDVMGYKVDSVYHPPGGGTITLMRGEGEAMFELIENSKFPAGLYSIGIDVDDLDKTLTDIKSKGANVLSEPIRTLVGVMAFIEDPNGTRMCLIEHNQEKALSGR